MTEGDRVLVYGGTGGVRHAVVQLAKALGAEVTATASSGEKAQIACDLGADHTSDYRTETPEALAERVTDGAGFDVVFDTIGEGHLSTAFQVARLNGHVVTTTSSDTLDLTPMHHKGLSLHVVFMLLPLLSGVGRERHGQALRYTADLVAEGTLRPLLDDQRFALFEAEAAHARAESGDLVGKVTLVPGAFDKPVVQPLYVDLDEHPDAPPRPIHLGLRLGVRALGSTFDALEAAGVNHVALNLRFNQADVEDTLRRLADALLPRFPSHD